MTAHQLDHDARAPGADPTGGTATTATRTVDLLTPWPLCGPVLRRHRLRYVDGPRTVDVVGSDIELDRSLEADEAGMAVAVREAVELAWLRPELATSATEGTLRILAHLAAVTDVVVVHRQPMPRSGVTTPEVLATIRRLIEALPGPDVALRRSVIDAVTRALAERDGAAEVDEAGELEAVERACLYALPTSVLFASGGKDGQLVDWTTGRNRYGVAPVPAPGTISLASCTASSPTEAAYQAAERCRRRLLEGALRDEHRGVIRQSWGTIRAELAQLLGLGRDEPDAAVLPTPSGTDAETVATVISLAAGRPLTTLLVGPLEVGSGTLQATLGRSFSTIAPNGRRTESGEPIPGMPRDIELVTVEVRDERGLPRAADEVATEIDALLDTLASAGHQILLHAIEGSKTGVAVPREQDLQRWEAVHHGQLDVIVDAAQLRVDDAAIEQHVAADRMVIVTGSKFYGGPPFSGALLVPSVLAARLATAHLPAGLADYLERGAVPPELEPLGRVASDTPNIGLLLRWTGAIEEMRAFLELPADLRAEVTSGLSGQVLAAIRMTPSVELVPCGVGREEGSGPAQTIFTLRLERDGRYVDEAELRRIQDAMRQDLTDRAPVPLDASMRAVLALPVDVGQPVPLGPAGSGGFGIRFAYSAPTLTRIARDPRLGENVPDRLRAVVADTALALQKLAYVAQWYAELALDEGGDAAV
jgi:hypothetical protein